MAIFLTRELTDLSLPQIGRLYGGRDHSTVLNSVRRVEAGVAEDPALAGRVDELRSAIHNHARERRLTADGAVRIGTFPQPPPQPENRIPRPNRPWPQQFPQPLIQLKKAFTT